MTTAVRPIPPPTEEWLFTFGFGHAHPNGFVRICGDWNAARAEMVRRFGSAWAFQYHSDEEHTLHSLGIEEVLS